MSSHLGDQIAALVDGQLDYARREKALEHLDRCPDCRAAVEHERWVKIQVQTLPGAEPSAALLCSLTQVTELPPFAPPEPTARSWLNPETRAARGGLLLAGAGSVAAGVLGLAYVVGGATVAEQRPITPPVSQFSAEFAGSGQPLPFGDPAVDAFPVFGNRATVGGP